MMKIATLLFAVCFVFTALTDDNVPGPDNVIRNPDGTIKRFSKEDS